VCEDFANRHVFSFISGHLQKVMLQSMQKGCTEVSFNFEFLCFYLDNDVKLHGPVLIGIHTSSKKDVSLRSESFFSQKYCLFVISCH
jgi:hypothetical protein